MLNLTGFVGWVVHGGAVVNTLTSQQEGSGFEPVGRLEPY